MYTTNEKAPTTGIVEAHGEERAMLEQSIPDFTRRVKTHELYRPAFCVGCEHTTCNSTPREQAICNDYDRIDLYNPEAEL